MTPNYPKFMFDLSFDPEALEDAAEREAEEARAASDEAEADAPGDEASDQAVEEVEPEEPPEPTYSEAEMLAERQKAHKEGKQAGNEEAWTQFRTQTDQMAVKALKVIGDQIKDLFDAQEKSNRAAYDDAMQVAVVMARKILPEMSRRGALDEVTAVLRDCLPLVIDEPQIVVTVHEKIADDMESRLMSMVEDSGFGGRVVLQTDETLEQTDVRVHWSTGGAERDTNKLWDEIDDAVVKGLDIRALPQRDLPMEKLAGSDADSGESGRDELSAVDDATGVLAGNEARTDTPAAEYDPDLMEDDGFDAAIADVGPAGDDQPLSPAE